MQRRWLALALLAGGSFLLQDISLGHGGTYRGPGDVVPPGGGGGGGGGDSGPSTGSPSGPYAPGSSPGTGSGQPGMPGGGAGRGGAASTGVGDASFDPSAWSFWWEFNKDAYLQLKQAIHADVPRTGSDDEFVRRAGGAAGKDSLRPTEQQIRTAVVPALLRALVTETNNDIVTGSMIALAKIGDAKSESGTSAFEGVIAKFLKDSNQEIAETAAVALGILANDSSVGVLESLLRDSRTGREAVGQPEVNYRTRAFAAYGLGLIGKRTSSAETRAAIVKTLFDALRSDQTRTRDVKVACLIALGLVPLDVFESTEMPATSAKAANDLSTRRGQIEALLAYFQDEKNHAIVRAHCPTALARLCADLPPERSADLKNRIVDALLERGGKRSNEPHEVIQSCMIGLGLFGDDDGDERDVKIRAALLAGPEDQSDQQARFFARLYLGYAGARKGEGADAEKLHEKSGLPLGAHEVAEEYLDQISKARGPIKQWTALGAGIFGRRMAESGRAIPALGQALVAVLSDTRSPGELGGIAIALGVLGHRDAAQPLRKLLPDLEDVAVQGYVCVALGLLDAIEASGEITAIVTESKYRPDLLKQAGIALGLLGDKDTVPQLVSMLDDAKSLASQASIASALGFIGDTRSIDPLVSMLQDESRTEKARGFAAAALGLVADRESLPWNSVIAADLNYRAATETLNQPETGTGILNLL